MRMAGKKMDERQLTLLNNGIAVSAIFAYIYEVILIIYKFNKTGDIKSAYMELGLIFVMLVGMIGFYIGIAQSDKSIEKAKKKKFFRKLDEREKRLLTQSLTASAVMAYFYGLIMIILKLVKTKTMKSAYTDIGLLAIMSVIITLYHVVKKEYHLPKTFTGKILSTGNSKEDKRTRYKRYFLDAFILSIIFLGIDIFMKDPIILFSSVFQSKILSYGVNTFLRIVLLFTIDYFWGEYNVKKYNEYYNSLIDEDED